MPDPTKHETLARAGFKIARTCSTCRHWTEAEGRWGHCALKPYQHGKHTDPRCAGTPDVGTCRDHETDPARLRARVGYDYSSRYGEDG